MPMKEIERKFLVDKSKWHKPDGGVYCKQGYLLADEKKAVRVRIMGEKAYVCIKLRQSELTRDEFEFEIPIEDANGLLEICCNGKFVEKIRYKLEFEGMPWEVDEFLGKNAGLIIAEIELESEDQKFNIPDWAYMEVSNQPQYLNMNLAR